MYHIKRDRRAERSAETIFCALAALMHEKPYEAITVRDIVERAAIGRSTFYRNFDQIEDVLHMRCDQIFDELIAYIADNRRDNPRRNRSLIFKPVLEYFDQNSEIVTLLMQANRLDLLRTSFRERSRPMQVQFAQQSLVAENYVAYLGEIRINVIIAIVSHWVKTGKQESADELAETLNSIMGQFIAYDQLL